MDAKELSLLAQLLSASQYAKLVEGPHPHTPSAAMLARMKEMARDMSAAERLQVYERARAHAAYYAAAAEYFAPKGMNMPTPDR